MEYFPGSVFRQYSRYRGKTLKMQTIISQVKHFEQNSGVKWVPVTFYSNKTEIPCNRRVKPLRFCEAIAVSRDKELTLTSEMLCCDGAKRSFGWLKDKDSELAARLADKSGMNITTTNKVISQVPKLDEEILAVSIGNYSNPDVLISYVEPEDVMRLLRSWQKLYGQNLPVKLSSVMAVCGNVAVASFIDNRITISFGCPDSRKYGGIEQNQLVVGLPFKLAMQLNEKGSMPNI